MRFWVILELGGRDRARKKRNFTLSLAVLCVFDGFRYFLGKAGSKDRQTNMKKHTKSSNSYYFQRFPTGGIWFEVAHITLSNDSHCSALGFAV